jgi:hypothetical protein
VGASEYGTPKKVYTVTLFLSGNGFGSLGPRSSGICSRGSLVGVQGRPRTTIRRPIKLPMVNCTITSSSRTCCPGNRGWVVVPQGFHKSIGRVGTGWKCVYCVQNSKSASIRRDLDREWQRQREWMSWIMAFRSSNKSSQLHCRLIGHREIITKQTKQKLNNKKEHWTTNQHRATLQI